MEARQSLGSEVFSSANQALPRVRPGDRQRAAESPPPKTRLEPRHRPDSEIFFSTNQKLRRVRPDGRRHCTGENADGMARRMATPDKPLETFLLLNGLAPGASLKFGEAYKVVVDQ